MVEKDEFETEVRGEARRTNRCQKQSSGLATHAQTGGAHAQQILSIMQKLCIRAVFCWTLRVPRQDVQEMRLREEVHKIEHEIFTRIFVGPNFGAPIDFPHSCETYKSISQFEELEKLWMGPNVEHEGDAGAFWRGRNIGKSSGSFVTSFVCV